MNPGTCKGCGRAVFFVTDKDSGKTQILDAVAPVYEIPLEDESACVRRRGYFVTHFATCPKASEFSRKQTRRKIGLAVGAEQAEG